MSHIQNKNFWVFKKCISQANASDISNGKANQNIQTKEVQYIAAVYYKQRLMDIWEGCVMWL